MLLLPPHYLSTSTAATTATTTNAANATIIVNIISNKHHHHIPLWQVNKNFAGGWLGDALLHICVREGYYAMVEFMINPKNRYSFVFFPTLPVLRRTSSTSLP
jgi:hypothetical protein